MATYAIGDIHGQRAALDDLLARIQPLLRAGDDLVFLGDYLDRGPDTKGVLDRLIALDTPARTTFLLGNHEEWFLETLRDRRSTSWLVGMEGLTTVASYSKEAAEKLLAALRAGGPKILRGEATVPFELFFDIFPAAHAEFLTKRLVPFTRTEDVLCVHGGVGATPPEREETRTLVWGPGGFPRTYEGSDIVVYGHHADPLVEDGCVRPREIPTAAGGRTFGIDTIAHGVLTAMRFPDRAVFQSAPVA